MLNHKSVHLCCCIALTAGNILLQSCGAIREERGTILGSAAGGSIGALIGKKAGNPAIGFTIGAAIGGSTGGFIGNKLSRSIDSLGRHTRPLYVINGTLFRIKEAQSRLSTILPAEIESIKVLTNNEATALYGTKGENGAILITVKSDKKI